MNRRTINILLCITCAACLSLATPVLASKITVSEMLSFNIEKTCPNSAFANEGRSQINELLAMDSFHPPMSDDPRILMYREWHYFNIFDEEQNLSFITTLTLNGNISDPTCLSHLKS